MMVISSTLITLQGYLGWNKMTWGKTFNVLSTYFESSNFPLYHWMLKTIVHIKKLVVCSIPHRGCDPGPPNLVATLSFNAHKSGWALNACSVLHHLGAAFALRRTETETWECIPWRGILACVKLAGCCLVKAGNRGGFWRCDAECPKHGLPPPLYT